MKSFCTKIGIAAATILLVFCTESWARSPKTRQLCGIIVEVDSTKRSLILQTPESDKPIELVWALDTRFIKKQRFIDSSQLKTGLRVCVDYHTPFFGKWF